MLQQYIIDTQISGIMGQLHVRLSKISNSTIMIMVSDNK